MTQATLQAPLPTARVFIDGTNIYHAQNLMGWEISWKSFVTYMQSHYNVLEFRYYVGVKPGDMGMHKFLYRLKSVGFTIVQKDVKQITIDANHPQFQLHGRTSIEKANFDVEITADIFMTCASADNVVLLSGDSDFAYLGSCLTQLNKTFCVLSSNRTLSYELRHSCQSLELLENIRQSIEFVKRP